MANANNEDAVVPNGHVPDQSEDLIDLQSTSDISLYPQTSPVDQVLSDSHSAHNGELPGCNSNSTLEREWEIQRKYLIQLQSKLEALTCRVDTIGERLSDLEYLEIRLKSRRPVVTRSEPEKSNDPEVTVTSDQACPQASTQVQTSRGI